MRAVIVFDKDVHKPNAYYIANTDFVEKYPSLVAKLNDDLRLRRRVGGQPSRGGRKGAGRGDRRRHRSSQTLRQLAPSYRVVPLDAEVIKSQQAVADRFAKLGLIPKPVNVSDIVWKWTPGS